MTRLLTVFIWLMLCAGAPVLAAPPPEQQQQQAPPSNPFPGVGNEQSAIPTMQEVLMAAVRLPVAALLGTALARRPRRRGTPPRQPAVIETQIILAAVGALIMLIVGASLARAFGIVGAANLIRYRSKIEDPKDAVVMLCALAVGLASGVGLFMLAGLSTAFLVALLWVIESFEPRTYKPFDLIVEVEKEAEALRPRVELILKKYRLPYEVRTLSPNQIGFDVQVPLDTATDPISLTIVGLAPKNDVKVDWKEKKPAKAA